jgi:hypothetical protein
MENPINSKIFEYHWDWLQNNHQRKWKVKQYEKREIPEFFIKNWDKISQVQERIKLFT